MVEYNELTGELVAELAAIVGEDNCLTGEDINEDYATTRCLFTARTCPTLWFFPQHR